MKPGEAGADRPALDVPDGALLDSALSSTEETFKGGWLHTGDIARADERGYLYIVDRKKDMIVSGGFNIFPREVEDVISSHPDVAMVAVIGVPHEKWGEAVTALVVAKQGVRPEAEAPSCSR